MQTTQPSNGDVIHATPDCLEQATTLAPEHAHIFTGTRSGALALARSFGVQLWTLLDSRLVLETEADEISDERISALRSEAATAGDSEQVTLCDRALANDDAARAECERVLREADARRAIGGHDHA